jgi:hypothetical protein
MTDLDSKEMSKNSGIKDLKLSGSGQNTFSPCETVQLFGHVSFVEGYALPNFLGCHAIVRLRDPPQNNVAVLTSEHRLQTILEVALSTGDLIVFFGQKLLNPPAPRGGTWTVDVYGIDGVAIYNFP